MGRPIKCNTFSIQVGVFVAPDLRTSSSGATCVKNIGLLTVPPPVDRRSPRLGRPSVHARGMVRRPCHNTRARPDCCPHYLIFF